MIWSLDCITVIVAARALDLHLPFPVAPASHDRHWAWAARCPPPRATSAFISSSTVSVLTPFGVSHDSALAFSLVSQAMSYLVVLVVGLPCLYRIKDWRKALPARNHV